MKTLTTYSVIASLMLSTLACQDKSLVLPDRDNDETPSAGLPPVETEKPHTDYRPAFEGQTRVPGMKTQTPIKVEVLTGSLGKPWGLIELPDGRLLITEKSGYMNIVSADGKSISRITAFPAVMDEGQGGMLDVALDPDFASNRTIYWTFSEKQGSGNLTAVGKGRLSADEKQVENATVIFRAEPAYNGKLHFGGRLVFGTDGNLFVSTGERSDLVTRPQAQQLDSYLGKVVRIDKNGRPPADNPFVGQGAVRPAIYSYGHRNVQGLTLHPETGELWQSEMGPMGGDEINLILAGRNYGWPVITYGLEYSGAKIGDGITQHAGMEQPVYYWDPSISPSGIDFYRASAIPEWKNNLFVGALSGQHIDRLLIRGNRVIGEERLLESENERFRDVLGARDGSLYAITDSGKLYRLSKK